MILSFRSSYFRPYATKISQKIRKLEIINLKIFLKFCKLVRVYLGEINIECYVISCTLIYRMCKFSLFYLK